MSEMLWHIAMSLDGYIAGSSEDMTWMRDQFGPDKSVDEVLEQIGAALVEAGSDEVVTSEACAADGETSTRPCVASTASGPVTGAPGSTAVSGEIRVRCAQQARRLLISTSLSRRRTPSRGSSTPRNDLTRSQSAA